MFADRDDAVPTATATSARRSTESRLREAEQGFGQVFENAPIGMALVSPTGRWLRVNPALCRLLGHPADQLLACAFQDLTHPEDLYLDLDFVGRMLAGEISSYEMEKRYFRGDGSVVWCLLSVSLVRDEDGAPRYFISQIQDIDVRKRAEARFRGLLESGPDAVVILDERGRIVLVNARTERLLGYPRDELVGSGVDALLPAGSRFGAAAADAAGAACPAGWTTTGQELTLRRKDGTELPVEITVSPLETDEGRLLSASIRDVSDRVAMVQALRDMNADLEAASRAKDEFLAGMSHELRTPLNVILGFAGILLMELPGPLLDEQRDQLRIVESNGKHLLSLINDLLDLAKLESGTYELFPEDVDCVSVLDDVVAALRPLAGQKKLGLSYSSPGATMVRADRRALTQILINLAGNAIKFTDDGEVRLGVRRCVQDGVASIRLTVADTGTGIAPGDVDRLFRAFEQVTGPSGRHRDGTGLGLHICRTLAGLMGARLSVTSRPGEGSEFTLEVPVLPAAMTARPDAPVV